MYSHFAFLVQIFLVRWCVAEFIYGNILDYAQNLTAVYRDPGHVFGEDLMRTAVFYLDELMELEEALEDKKEEKKALEMLSQLYHQGGPKHTSDVPYARLIDTYNWPSKEIDDYGKYIEMTNKSWNRLLTLIKTYVESGKMKSNT